MTKNNKQKLTCENCSNAIYDPVWGEWKCKIIKSRVMPGYVTCISGKRGTPTISKREPKGLSE